MHSNQKKQQHTSVQSQRNRISKRARERQQQTKHYEIDPYQAKLPPPGCSIFNNGGGSGSFQHVILFPGVKMAFCGIPKGESVEKQQYNVLSTQDMFKCRHMIHVLHRLTIQHYSLIYIHKPQFIHLYKSASLNGYSFYDLHSVPKII